MHGSPQLAERDHPISRLSLYFNAVCIDPPLLAFAPGLRPSKTSTLNEGEPKDTLRNIREAEEFVVSIVTFALVESMNITSGEYHASVNEWDLAHVTPEPSRLVRPCRVKESPVSFECKLHQIVDFSPAPTSSSLVIGRVVALHINDENLKDGRLDRNSLDLIGRMGGIQYARTRDRFELARPKVE